VVEIFIPPIPAPGCPPVCVDDGADAIALLSAFALSSGCARQLGEVIMIALGPDRELLAVVAFGEVALDRIVEDPRPLVGLARESGCSSVMLAQVGEAADDVVEARRVIGSALEIDDIELAEWLDSDSDWFRSCE